MDDYFPKQKNCLKRFFGLLKWRFRFPGITGTKKLYILVTAILVLSIRLFFYSSLADLIRPVYASKEENKSSVNWGEIEDLLNIRDQVFPLTETEEDKLYTPLSEEENDLLAKEREEKEQKEKFRQDILDLVAGYPMEEMVPALLDQEAETAKFLVAIAKKESDWGKHSPRKNGKTCYNYWGYKGAYNLSSSGYSCFNSPEQAVEVVGERISQLIKKNIDTPERMVVWKCGSSCAGHDPGGVKKWISDVRIYLNKLES